METKYLDKKPLQAGKLNIFDNLARQLWGEQFAGVTEEGLISGLDQTQLAICIDSSHWSGPLSADLVTGAALVQPKSTDGNQIVSGSWYDLGTFIDDQFHKTVDLCYRIGRPVIPFHYLQHQYEGWNRDQIVGHQFNVIQNAFKVLIPLRSYHGLALDIEEKGNTDTNLAWIVSELYNQLKNSVKFRDVPILIYSSVSYLHGYPALENWVGLKGAERYLWLAQWPWTRAWSGTWAEYRAQVLPNINMKVLTPGYQNFTEVQYVASCRPCGIGVDISAWNRKQADLWSWLKFAPDEEPAPVSQVDWDKVRAAGHSNWDAFVDQQKQLYS